MTTFGIWLEERDPQLAEGLRNWMQNAALAGAVGMGSMFGGQAMGQQPMQPVQQQMQKEIKQIGNNVYEVIGTGRVSKIGGPTYAHNQAKKDAITKLFKHLKIQNTNVSVEPKEVISKDGNSVVIKYQITLK